jgi:hypothetical protein
MSSFGRGDLDEKDKPFTINNVNLEKLSPKMSS